MRSPTVLPVFARELLVGSRRKQTYQARMALGLTGTIIIAVTTLVFDWFGAPPIKGAQLFQFLTFVMYIGALMAANGTLDAVSLEKREGTLGLLFLTGLKGYDVALGKLAPAFLLSFYGLISITPILAVPMLMGGVSFGELARTALALSLVLLWSLSLGLLVSTVVRNAPRAMAFVAISLAVWGLAAFEVLTKTPLQQKAPELIALVLLFNPKQLVNLAGGSAYGLSSGLFWASVATHVAMILVLLLGACWLLPRTWQEKAASVKGAAWRERFWKWRYGRNNTRVRYRKRLTSMNPVMWLRAREVVGVPGFWLVFLLVGIAALALAKWMPGNAPPLAKFGMGWLFGGIILGAWTLGTIPAAMGQSLAEDRQSGALDLLVSAPLTSKQIVRGHWLAAARNLALPLFGLALLGALLLAWFLAIFAIEEKIFFDYWAQLKLALRAAISTDAPRRTEAAVVALLMTGGALLLPIAIYALGWAGVWLGLKVQQPKNVAGLSFPMVVMPPWALWLPIRAVIIYGNAKFSWNVPENGCAMTALWFLCAYAYMLTLALAIRRKVLRQFRAMATDRYTNIESSRWARWLGLRAHGGSA